MSEPVSVHNNREANRFEVKKDGELAELDYQLQDDRIIFTHTGVPDSLEGQGIGGALAKAGLTYAREHNLQVVPLCPFVRSYIERKPQFQDLVSTRSSGGFA